MSTVANKSRLEVAYDKDIKLALKEEIGQSSVMAVPKLDKIVVNMGVGNATQDKKLLEDALYTLTMISGQKPVVTTARKAISNFKLRVGMPIGCKVTLRGKQMYEFFDRLVSVALPRVKDFRGISPKSFDGQGNYTLGIEENIVFLEVDRDKISRIMGMDITICTTATTDNDGKALLAKMGMPFRK
ncbi:50S ribosomal protein L5 [Chitinivibrio alkaliphilus]|uniref:Large ribosomal subunit protein uL5 n=1 Tax=Chitinivibrio alkaliphilus ACht1 TaxID=1313304 RepID=U7D6V7_9BACT|nr:50S ribosomal protein L5 [Chitinivibrio alkaliphilus]ERP31301.1 50S ribosomal protein L5 [Chitinivibrio alkaliphilus ACht1]